MYRYIWLVPLLPLAGAALNGLLGRKLRFSETVVSVIAVGSIALAFLLSVAAVYSYGFGGKDARWPNAYLTSEDGFGYTWIPGGAVEITQGAPERAQGGREALTAEIAGTHGSASTESNIVNEGIGKPILGTAHPGETTQDPVGLGERAAHDTRRNEHSGRGSLLDIQWSYQLDPLSSIFMLIITGVGLCIFVFATGYMHGDAGFYRFFAYLGLFMFMMLVLVMGSNFLMMFVGWEGVGLCSYLLIGYYFDRKEAGDAARKAFVANRIGDFGFALAVFGIIATFGSAQYSNVMDQARSYPLEALGHWGLMSWLALGLFVGACGKSAQIPLYVWLPDAMAGPTPVSALIHAATMVTAGLYMLTRTNVIFQHSQTMMLVVASVGALTAIFAATIGITQNDIKKVLAYSTVSQLGFMFLACGTGAFVIGIFHVMTHAFFKALMFLGAGSVIHGMHHEQDMRRMGGLKKYMPYTYWTFLAGWLAICGIIPFSGFWSKDEILWNAASTTYIPYGWLLWLVGTIAATCTAFYMTRLVAMTFWGKERFLEHSAGGEADEAHAHAFDEGLKPHDARRESAGDRPHHEPGEHVGVAHDLNVSVTSDAHATHDAHGHDAHEHDDSHGHGAHIPHESPPAMWIPLAVLAVLAIIGGLIGVGPAFQKLTGSEHPGGHANIVNWLQPVIWNPQTREYGKEHEVEGATEPGKPAHESNGPLASSAASSLTQEQHSSVGGGEETATPYGNTGFNLAHAAEKTLGSHAASEWLFIIISLLAAGIGMGLGWLFYIKDTSLPEVWASRLAPLYRASYNKYWIDELYGVLFTRRTMDAARGVYTVDSEGIDGAVNGIASMTRAASRGTGVFDRLVVDGAVNAVAGFIGRLMSPLIRSAQTGFAQNYALVMVLGLVAAVVFFFGREFF
jgi:NADH-quinone oxidoreductase subunit L